MEQTSNKAVTDERTRHLSIAVANWLCGTLEGISNDSVDATLTEALDTWLRKQKDRLRTLYIGQVTCSSCGDTWEAIVASDDTQLNCPHCGYRVKTAPVPPSKGKNTVPENRAALDTIRKSLDDVAARMASIHRYIEEAT